MRSLAVIVLVALGLGAFLVLRDGSDRGPAAQRESRDAALASVEGSAADSAPLLEGRPAGRTTRDARAGSERAGSAEVPPSEDGSSATATESAADALIQRIQREVEPEAWLEGGGAAMKMQGGQNLVVKAPAPVLEAVGEFLEGLREEALTLALREAEGSAASEPAEPADREGGEAALREILRGMLAQWRRLEGALRARAESRIPDAIRFLDEVLLKEPDHRVAAAYRKMLLDPPPAEPQPQLVDLDHVGNDIESRVRALSPGRLATWIQSWPSPKTFAALDRARRRARMERWTITGEERDRRLARAAPSVRLEGLDLVEAVQRLSVETLIDLDVDWSVRNLVETLVDPSVTSGLPRPGLGRLAPTDGTLAALLQAMATSIGPRLRFKTYARVLLLADVERVPGTLVWVFNVSDVLDVDAAR